MLKALGQALLRAAQSEAGKQVLTLGGVWLVTRLTKGSPKAQKIVAMTAREYTKLEMLAAQSGTPVDDVLVDALKEGVTKSEAKLIDSTIKLLRESAKEPTGEP
jgi:DNA-binding response OmpR family regulator